MSKKTLEALIKENDQYIAFGDTEKKRHYFPSGIVGLNYIMTDEGNGIPGGTIVQLIGENKHGKSTLSLDFIAQAQKTGLKEIKIQSRAINCAIIDFEHSFDPVYAEMIGVDVSKVFVVAPIYAENGFDLTLALLEEGLQLIVIDSVGMLVAQSEEDKSSEDTAKIGAEALPLTRFLKKVNALADIHNALVIVINQYRANISPVARTDKKAYGARVLQYVAKITIKITRIGTDGKAGKAETEAFIEKTKFGIEGLKAKFDIVFGKGIDYVGHVLTLSLEHGIIEMKGKGWYYYPSYEDAQYRAQGLDNAGELFPIEEIQDKLLAVLKESE